MSRGVNPSPNSFVRNLLAGSYGPVERLRVIRSNIRRKTGRKGCCGNYGEPGC